MDFSTPCGVLVKSVYSYIWQPGKSQNNKLNCVKYHITLYTCTCKWFWLIFVYMQETVKFVLKKKTFLYKVFICVTMVYNIFLNIQDLLNIKGLMIKHIFIQHSSIP